MRIDLLPDSFQILVTQGITWQLGMLAHQLLSTDGTPVHSPLCQFWRVPLTTTRNWNINTSVQPLTFTLALLSARSLGRRRRVSPLLNDLKANKSAQVSRLNPYLSNWNIRKGLAKMANLSAPWDNTSIASKILEWSCCTALTNHSLPYSYAVFAVLHPLPPPPPPATEWYGRTIYY